MHRISRARRLATANFIAFAPDGLTSVGGYPGDKEAARKELQGDRRWERDETSRVIPS
jgi:hypothetical protein